MFHGSFGNFLLDEGVVTGADLQRARQLQDRHGGPNVAVCLIALGILPAFRVQQLLEAWNAAEIASERYGTR